VGASSLFENLLKTEFAKSKLYQSISPLHAEKQQQAKSEGKGV